MEGEASRALGVALIRRPPPTRYPRPDRAPGSNPDDGTQVTDKVLSGINKLISLNTLTDEGGLQWVDG